MDAEIRWRLVSEHCAIAYRRGDTRMHKDQPAAFIDVADPGKLHGIMVAAEKVLSPEPEGEG